jgi:hypothetical protein
MQQKLMTDFVQAPGEWKSKHAKFQELNLY